RDERIGEPIVEPEVRQIDSFADRYLGGIIEGLRVGKSRAYLESGRTYAAKGEHGLARWLLEHAVISDPTSVEAINALADVYTRSLRDEQREHLIIHCVRPGSEEIGVLLARRALQAAQRPSPPAAHAEKRPIFVGGVGRSGTSVVVSLLDHHPDLATI